MTDRFLEAKIVKELLRTPATAGELTRWLIHDAGKEEIEEVLHGNPGFVADRSRRPTVWSFDPIQYKITFDKEPLEEFADAVSSFSTGKSVVRVLPRVNNNVIYFEDADPENLTPGEILTHLKYEADFPFLLAVLDRARNRAVDYNSGVISENNKWLIMDGVYVEISKIIPALQSLNHLISYIINDPRRGTPEEWAILLTKPAKPKD